MLPSARVPPGAAGPHRGPGAPAGPHRGRGAPAAGGGPGADELTQHNLYVKVVTGDDPDSVSRGYTLEVLNFVHANLAQLARMGLAVKVNKVTTAQLRNEQVRAAMKSRGISRLPALTTPNGVYLGFQEIRGLYERNIAEFEAFVRRSEPPVVGSAPPDELEDYYREEMSIEKARADDKEDDTFGEGSDMMDSYRRMMERREGAENGRRPRAKAPGASAPPAAAGPARAEPRAAPPRTTGSGRPDNVGALAARPRSALAGPADEEEAEIQDTIDRLSRDIDTNLRDAAFNSGGGDSYEGDESTDPQDDLMEQAYWARAADSVPEL